MFLSKLPEKLLPEIIKNMKLCFIASIEDNHTRKWIKYFIEKGYEIHWISHPSKHIKEVEADNVKFYLIRDFKSKSLNILLNIMAVRKIIKEVNPDFLHAHYAGVNGVLGALSGFHPFFTTAYGSDVLIAPKSKIVKMAVRFALKRADLITCDGENSKKAMVDMGIDGNKIKVIYFGVDVLKFCPGKKEELGYPVIISIRSLKPVYNVETLVKAVPYVIKEVPGAKFVIGGEGPEENKLKQLAKSLGVLENIVFAGWISKEELPNYLRSSDIYVSTSLSDGGISLSTAEAMACGLPAVITNFGDNSKWVKDGENGFTFPPKNEKVLAEKIIYLLKNNELRKEFGENNRKVIEQRDNYYREMEKTEKIYENSFYTAKRGI